MAGAILAELRVAGGDVPCEEIFSDEVCSAIGDAWGTVRDILDDVLYYLSDEPPTVDEIRYFVLRVADCIVHQTCIAPPDQTRGSADPCREVFSDGICSRVEDPVGTAQWAYDTLLRCYLDPACTPTPSICFEVLCIRPF